MAAFAASPMPYRAFGTGAVAPAPAERSINRIAAAEPLNDAGQAAAFPLLVAALPEVTQFSMPHPPPVEVTESAKPLAPGPKSQEAPQTLGMSAPEMSVIAQQTDTFELPSRPAFNVPVSQASVRRKPKQHTVSPPVNSVQTPLATMFHILQAASPPRQERTALQSELQSMFRRL
jgi:hypothetical protein